MRTNSRPIPIRTHEGGKAGPKGEPILELRRRVNTCLLWENTFYETGNSIAAEIAALVPKCNPQEVMELAIEARQRLNLRHVPMFLIRELARVPNVGKFVERGLLGIIQRADELAEFVALYWKDKKQPLSAATKRGLAGAFPRFNEYQLAKYDRANVVRLRDVLFLTHPKPEGAEQAALWKRLVDNQLATPDTWEVELSAGKDKCETFTRLLKEKKLGGMATLRNLRNMLDAGVDRDLITERLMDGTRGALPFQYVTAARYAPQVESGIEKAMFKAMEGMERLHGSTGILIDVSGSMDTMISAKGEAPRVDAAGGLAIYLREICPDLQVATFSDRTVEVPARRGFALRDAIAKSQPHSATYLKRSLDDLKGRGWAGLTRLIVVTDEQSQDGISQAWAPHSYVINVAPYTHGVGSNAGWTKIDGWSERVVDWIRLYEEEGK